MYKVPLKLENEKLRTDAREVRRTSGDTGSTKEIEKPSLKTRWNFESSGVNGLGI